MYLQGLPLSTDIKTYNCCQEFLLTLGVSGDKSSTATIMIYSQVLWALIIDRVVWQVKMNIWTFVGVGGVVGSLILVSMAKEITVFQTTHTSKYETVPIGDENGMTIYEVDLDDIYDDDDV